MTVQVGCFVYRFCCGHTRGTYQFMRYTPHEEKKRFGGVRLILYMILYSIVYICYRPFDFLNTFKK